MGTIATVAAGGFLLPQTTLKRLGIIHRNETWPKKEWLLNRALRIDDDVAEALYSRNRLVPTYMKSQITPLKNNYNGATPDPGYIPEWRLTLEGLDSGLSMSLNIRSLFASFQLQEQITRLVCVEGWSAIAWWAGFRFDELLRAYPPMSQAKWARLESSVNLGPWGNPDPYFMSLDLSTASHPQTLLATHLNGKPLTVEHGAPLRLLVPVKLGLKNIKAITRITCFDLRSGSRAIQKSNHGESGRCVASFFPSRHLQFGNIVPGVFTPVLAKHSKSFSLIDCVSVGVDRRQRNFEPMGK